MPKFTRSFITGSWAYGSPRFPERGFLYPECEGEGCRKCKSDVDLVILVSKDDLDTLSQESDSCTGDEYAGALSLRFGNLNLLCQTTDADFDRWRRGTRILQQLQNLRDCDVSRDEAVKLFARLREDDYKFWWDHSDEINKLTAKGIRDGFIIVQKKSA